MKKALANVVRYLLAIPALLLAPLLPVWGEATFPVNSQLTIQVPPDRSRTHGAVITALSLHPDGTLVAAAGDDHIIRLWNLQDGSLVSRLTGHRDWIRAIQFAPDGTKLVSSGNDRHVVMWDVDTGRVETTLAVHDQAVDAVAFSHSGRWVATAGFGNRISILDTTDQAERRQFECNCRDIRTLAISEDDQYLAAGGRDGMIRIWDLSTGKLFRESNSHQQRIRAIAFAQEGVQVISGAEDGLIRIWNWQTDGQAVALPRLPCRIMTLATCGPDILATAGSDNMIRLWNLATREQLGQLTGHTGSVAALDYRDGMLVSGGFDTSLRVWALPASIEGGIRSAQRDE